MKVPPVNATPANYPAIPQPKPQAAAAAILCDQLAQIANSLIRH